jgi:hypothetical protein
MPQILIIWGILMERRVKLCLCLILFSQSPFRRPLQFIVKRIYPLIVQVFLIHKSYH